MGSFRSQPDLQKHTDLNQGIGLSYVSTHMCGNFLFKTKAGEFTCRMHICQFLLSATRRTRCSQSSMDMEVRINLILGAEVSKYVERHFVKEL